jgi:hypothetical protein
LMTIKTSSNNYFFIVTGNRLSVFQVWGKSTMLD